jgi:hypothetical protein
MQAEIDAGLPYHMGRWHREQLELEFGRGLTLEELLERAAQERRLGESAKK